MGIARAADIEDLRTMAQRRLPRMVFDYVDGGSYAEEALRANRASFLRHTLRQRVLDPVGRPDTAIDLLGERWDMPVMLAPCGLTGMVARDGEACAARAAVSSGVPFCLSTASVMSMEAIARDAAPGFWFQLYVMRDRSVTGDLLARAREAGCRALVVTLDMPVQGQRHRDYRNGFSVPPRPSLGTVLDVMRRPRWALDVLARQKLTFGNLAELRQTGSNSLLTLAQFINNQFEPEITVADLEWLRSQWDGPLVVKGVLDASDAARAVDAGADGVIVSNHGGRQMDGCAAALDALPAVVDALHGTIPILFDSGIRSGVDVLRALALGASACLVGRPYLYGLGAGGEAGVVRALEILRAEMTAAMTFMGARDIASVTPDSLVQRPS